MIDVGWLTLGVVLLIAEAGAIWKLSTLRTDVSDKWGERVLVDAAGLDEQAILALRRVRTDIDELLVDEESFDPRNVLADPSRVKARLTRYSKLLKARGRLMSRYNWLLRVGPTLLISVATFGIGVAMALGHLAGLWNTGSVAAVGWVLMVVGGAMAILVGIAYAYLEYSLSKAETLSRSET